MNTEELIRKITDEGAARPLLHPVLQSIIWITGILIYLIFLIQFSEFRSDVSEKLELPGFALELLFLLMVGIFAGFSAFCLSRPDGLQLPWARLAPWPLLLIWLWIAFTGAGAELGSGSLRQSATLDAIDCPIHILFFSALPGIVIFLMIRMGTVIRYYRAGLMSTLSVVAFAYLFMRLIESNDNPAHLLIWHVLPVFLMCLIGMYAGRRALRWT